MLNWFMGQRRSREGHLINCIGEARWKKITYQEHFSSKMAKPTNPRGGQHCTSEQHWHHRAKPKLSKANNRLHSIPSCTEGPLIVGTQEQCDTQLPPSTMRLNCVCQIYISTEESSPTMTQQSAIQTHHSSHPSNNGQCNKTGWNLAGSECSSGCLRRVPLTILYIAKWYAWLFIFLNISIPYPYE